MIQGSLEQMLCLDLKEINMEQLSGIHRVVMHIHCAVKHITAATAASCFTNSNYGVLDTALCDKVC